MSVDLTLTAVELFFLLPFFLFGEVLLEAGSTGCDTSLQSLSLGSSVSRKVNETLFCFLTVSSSGLFSILVKSFRFGIIATLVVNHSSTSNVSAII